MTEKKGLLFLSRRIGERIKITVGDEVVEVILRGTAANSADIGIRASKSVKINRLEAEDDILLAYASKKDDKFSKRRMKGLYNLSKPEDSLSTGAYSFTSIKEVPRAYMEAILISSENKYDIDLINNELERRRLRHVDSEE